VKPERGEAGFTLVELLIVIVIESLIVTGLGSAFILIMNNSTTVKDSLTRTNDARYAASYIVSDARNSSGPETSLSDTTSCPDANPPVAGTPTAVARFDWLSTSSTGATTANIINYVLVSNALLRRQCQNGTLVSDDALATSIASATVSCAPPADCSGTPTTITATITETQGSSSGAAYQYSLTGAFRKVLAVGSALPSSNIPQLIALGGAGCVSGATAVKVGGTSIVRVHGDAYLNTADIGACNAMALASSGSFRTTGNTKILTGGTCSHSVSSVCPTTTSYSPAIANPYAGIAAPSTSGLPSQAGCAGGTAQPGVYAATLTIGAGVNCNLAGGVYIFQNGLSVTNSGILTSAAAGVLLYVTGGTFSIGGGSSQVNLAAMTSGTYAGIVVWQAAADTTTLSFASGPQAAFTGAIYAPAAELSVGGTSQESATAVVVQNLVIVSSGALVIGTPLSVSSPTTLPAWTMNQLYPSGSSTTLTAAGGDGNYTWSATGLPAGLSIDAGTGVISGTPTTAAVSTPTFTLSDAFGDTAATKQYTIAINAAPSISTSSPLPTWGQNVANYSTTVAGSAGTTPYVWSATGLPAGLTMNSSTGVVSGTPTAAGVSTVAVTLTDASGVTATKNLSLTISTNPIITSIALANGGSIPGKLEKGDTITVTFSAQMSVSSFCSAWSGNASNQSLSASNDVNVALTNGTGATNDSLTVTSASCTFNFGTLNLGSPSYVSSVVSFGGSGANVSTIAWNATAHTLTITLGAQKSGTVLNVASSAPVYTASGSVVDGTGAAIGNSPFTLPTVQQF
jgi:type II secretory pathway component PulJ